MTTRRHPRTLTEAWPQHYAWRGVIQHYRRPMAERLARLMGNAAVLVTLGGIGVLLAWKG